MLYIFVYTSIKSLEGHRESDTLVASREESRWLINFSGRETALHILCNFKFLNYVNVLSINKLKFLKISKINQNKSVYTEKFYLKTLKNKPTKSMQ